MNKTATAILTALIVLTCQLPAFADQAPVEFQDREGLTETVDDRNMPRRRI